MADYQNKKINEYRDLPKVDRLLEAPSIAQLEESFGRNLVRSKVREALDWARAQLAQGPLDSDAIVQQVCQAVQKDSGQMLVSVVNATGVILHTNLGRAPLADHVIDRVREVAQGFANLELELESGKRGKRGGAVESLLCSITGAEAALCVNNNAAAVLLALAAICQNGEAVVSRGELVEIGGSFRMPDVMSMSGTSLVEVGTTNRTRSEDFAAVIRPETRALVRVHRGNFHQGGFVENPSFASVAELAREHGVPLLVDLGHGAMMEMEIPEGDGLPPSVQACLKAGADLVLASADKLLGGPQAGLIVGRKDLVDKLRSHALHRAVRADKMTLAALEAVLLDYACGRFESIPVLRMIQEPEEAVQGRVDSVMALAEESLNQAGFNLLRVSCLSMVGGGSDPRFTVPSVAIQLAHPDISMEECARWLRQEETPILGRLKDDHLMLDMRTVMDSQVEGVARSLRLMALKGKPQSV